MVTWPPCDISAPVMAELGPGVVIKPSQLSRFITSMKRNSTRPCLW